MSGKRSSKKHCSNVTENEIQDLVLKLRAMLHAEANQSDTSNLLEEASNHIKKLQRKVNDLSERISELMDLPGTSSDHVNFIRKLLQK